MTDVADDILVARAYLSRVAEPGSVAVWDWVTRHGPVDAGASIRSGDVDSTVAAATASRRTHADPEADLDAAARHGIRLLVPEDDRWPHFALAALEASGRRLVITRRAVPASRHDGGAPIPPLALWTIGTGETTCLGWRSVAVVGARAATAYGEHVTADFAYGLARRRITIVSGGAYGIDAAAHRAALAAGGSTVLISAGGVDRPYPTAHARLFGDVAASGLIVSESPPGTAPHRHRFLTRNRLIAAFGAGTVVVEAALRSGALNTAKHSRLQGRTVMAVPGPVTSSTSAGCHALLRDETEAALLVTSVDEVLAVVGSIGEVEGGDPGGGGAVSSGPSSDLRSRLGALDATAQRVFDGLPARGAVHPDEVAIRSGVPPLDVIRAVPALRLAGLVESTDEGLRIATGSSRSGRPKEGAEQR